MAVHAQYRATAPLSGAQLDTVHCEASSTMVGETQSLSSQSS